MACESCEWGALMVGTLVQKTRKARGLTQIDLGRRTGLSQNYISKLETGQVDLPQRGTLDALAGALDVPVGDFYRAAGVLPRRGEPDARERVALPAPLVEALEEMVRRYPELRVQIDGWHDDAERPGRIVDLARVLGIVIRGWVDDLPRSDDGQ
jgi:transcriptional regulator with XRE-family HTH domain